MRRIAALFPWMLFVAAPALAQQAAPAPVLPVVVTHGQASVKRAPDQAWVSVAAESRAATPAEAQRAAADAMRTVLQAISRAGIPDNAVRTTGYTLQPDLEYVNGRSRVRGYIARNQVEARVDDLGKLAGVLDAAGASGATSMAGLRFDLKDRASVEREALRLAVEDAMARARAIALGARAELGGIVRIDEQGESAPPGIVMAMRAETAAAAQTPVSAGEIEIRAHVTLTVAIKGTDPISTGFPQLGSVPNCGKPVEMGSVPYCPMSSGLVTDRTVSRSGSAAASSSAECTPRSLNRRAPGSTFCSSDPTSRS